MSLLSYMHEKASEKGITICENCGSPDIFFGLAGKCTECESALPIKDEKQTLQFSIEILVYFTNKYDEFMPEDAKKIFVQLGRAIVHKLKETKAVDYSKLIGFQSLCKHIPILGSEKFGGAIDGQKMAVQLLEHSNALTIGKSLGACVLALKYIKQYKVPNEYMINTERFVSKNKSPNTNSKNSGCMTSVLLVAVFFITGIYFITTLL